MFNTTQIVLISPQQGYLDVDKNAEIPFTFAIGDIRDISKKQGTFSKTIKLAGTKNNNILLNNYFDVNIQEGTFNVTKLQKCQVIQNGVPILKDGFLQLLNVKKTQNNSATEQLVEYEVVIKDTVSDLFTKINNLELTDLEFGYLDHLLTADQVISTLNNTWEDEYKYFFTNIESTVYSLDYFKPAIFAKSYFDKIIEGAGFQYQWDTFSADTVQFDKLLIPYNGDVLKADQTFIDGVKVEASKTGDTVYSAVTGVTNFEIETTDNTNAFNPVTGRYDNIYYIANGATLNFQMEIEYEVVLKNYENSTSYLVSNYNNSGVKYVPKAKLKKNSLVIPIASTNIAQSENEYVVTQGNSLSALQEVSFGTFTRIVNLATNSALPGDFFTLLLGFDGSTVGGSQFAVQQVSSQPSRWRTALADDAPFANVFPQLRIKNINLLIQPSLNSIGYNATVRINSVIPAKIKQSDFVKSILTMYNLYVEIDENQPNLLIFKHRDEFYDEGPEVDWTDKLAKDKEQILTLLPDVASKKILMTYKHDDNDSMLKGYKDNVKEIYGQVEYTFDSEYVRGTKTKELIFSPITVGRDLNNNVLPYLNGIAPKNNIKIALNPYQYESEAVLTILNYQSETLTGTSSTATTVPLISHFDAEENPSFDINFGVNDFYFYNTYGTLTNNNLYNLHWRRTINQINTGKMLSAYFYLNETDINQLKLNQKVFINNAWWNINQIIDYKAGKKELTKVELLSIDDELKFSPFITRVSGKPSSGDVALEIVRNFITEVDSDSNTVIGTIPAVVVGRNNFVNGNSRNLAIYGDNNNVTGPNAFIIGDNNITQNSSIVFGSNNIVDENANNIFVLGNGVTATTSDTLYVPNIILPSGGTINGVTVETIDFWITGTGTESIRRNNTTATIASGNFSYSEGIATTASNTGAHAEGFVTIASGINSHAEGRTTTASGNRAHSEGESTIASGARAHAEGFLTTAIGNESHAEGGSTIASGPQSHAEGNTTIASGDRAHSEGELTLASGDYSHAEGYATQASGIYSHAQGSQTVADGAYSHAEGGSTTADGDYSHSEGNTTIALGFESHAGGFGSITQVDGEFARASYTTLAVLSQYGILHGINNTTNATADVIQFYVGHSLVNGYVLPTNTTMSFTYQVVARNTATGASRLITGEGLVKNISGTNTLVFGTSINNNGDAGLAGITAVPVLSTGAPTIQITGLAATNINWSGRIDYNLIGN
jgi:hypothetical protein